MKVKLIKKIKKNTPPEKEVDRNESKMRHAGRTDFDFTACAYEDLQDDLGKEQKVEDQVTREILFRGKREDNGEWVKGYYGLILYPFTKEFYGLTFDPFVARTLKPYISGSSFFGGYFVNPETVGQFTGHTDKNGVKIFEGDIIDMTGEEWDAAGPAGRNSPICAVEFDKFTGGFNPFANYDCDCGVYIDAGGCEVIGNRWDNPELLEEKSDG